jgi:class 3 adenylate cyclase/tetratricopeptide (TPR) repeat protein
VSVLFADLVGFTQLSQARDSEDVRALQHQYFDTCRRLIEIYGGTVEKFIGDAVMAVWGTPVATEDDAERAVRAGLDLVAAVTALGDEIGIDDLRARASVQTGEATVTAGADGEGMVTGDIVNAASRVQSVADPGQVLVGDATRRATEPTIVYEDAGTHELKGLGGLHRVWRAVRVVSGARGALKSEGLEAPFVGRDRELRQIKDLYHACADERRAHLVSVTGIAGIGKSRVVWEFYKYFDGLAQLIYWHRGRCLSYGEGVTYWALADMVRMRCRISEDEEESSALAKLGGVLDEHVPDTDERAFVEPRVAHLLGLEGGATFNREELFAAWRTFFERLAQVNPTVLAFEDMQWADASLLDFIEYLLEWSRQSPLFVITAARPELVEKRPTWGAGERNFTSMYLEPLSAPAMRDLLEGLVPGLPNTLRDQILARAEGVPLYAMETVRMLLDRGLLVRDGSVYSPAGEVEALEVPETLHALIAARLDGLSAQERRVVQDGAVLGKSFTKAALAALGDAREDELDPVLSSLVRKEVFSIQADPRSPEHGQYGFLQDLVRHVSYETLSRRDRHLRHLAAAAYLEQAFPDDDEIVEVLASHYLDAHRSAPEGSGSDAGSRARGLLQRAGQRAESLGAASEALRYYAQGADLTDDPSARAALLHRAADMALRSAAFETAGDLAGQARDLYESIGDTGAAARSSLVIARVEQYMGRRPQAIELMERVGDVLRADDPQGEEFADLIVGLAGANYFIGNVPRASELVEQALDIGEAQGYEPVLANGWHIKAMICASGRRPEEARGLFEQSFRLALERGARDSASRTAGNLSDISFRRDRYRDALGYLDQALELARTAGSRLYEWFAISESTYALYMLGRWDEALAAFHELPEDRLTSGGTLLSPLSSIFEIHLHRGEIDEARRVFELYRRLETSTDVQELACYLAAGAAVATTDARYEDALAAHERVVPYLETLGVDGQDMKQSLCWAMTAARALGDRGHLEKLATQVEAIPPGLRPPVVDAYGHMMRGWLATGADETDRELRAAESRFREASVPFWVAVTLLERATSGSTGGQDADALLAEARPIFEGLGATPWVERVDDARSSVSV